MLRPVAASRLLLLGVALAVFTLLGAACGDDDDAATPVASNTSEPAGETSVASEATVAVVDNAFSPDAVTIKTGGTVTWEWGGQNPHSVVIASLDVESETLTGSGAFSQTFDTPGTYAYQCGIHGQAMSGTVVVEG